MADPRLVQMIVKAAKQTGADPRALLATTLRESGGRFGAVGDQGTSFGPFQFHRGGALGSHNAAWANSYDAILNRATEFAKYGVHGGKGAAAIQRPADAAGYATAVDSMLGKAGSILKSSNGNLKLPDGTVAKSVLPKPSQAAPNASPLLTPGETTTPTAGPLGGLTAGGFAQQAREQLGLKGTDPLAKLQSMLPLPDGTTAQTTVQPVQPGTPKVNDGNKVKTTVGIPGRVDTLKNPKIIGTPHTGTHTLGNWESDNAVDIAMPKGTPLYATADGTIGDQFGSLGASSGRFAGLRLHLKTANDELYYAHLSKFAPGLKPGAQVKKGQLLGYSGVANGVAHLHLGSKAGTPGKYE